MNPPADPRVGRVLAVFSHPDDETFGPGGTLAALTDAGHRVHLLCATRGEAGSIGISRSLGTSALAHTRTAELEAACAVLGVQRPRWLDLPDGRLASLARSQLLEPIVQAIRELKPHVLLTFDAGGLSGHADHRAITAATVSALPLAAQTSWMPELGLPHQVDRLWLFSIPESKARWVTHRKLESVPDAQVDAWIDITDTVDRKRAAVAAHATQRPFIDDLEQRVGDLDAFWNPEAFTLGWSAHPIAQRPLTDLLAGLDL